MPVLSHEISRVHGSQGLPEDTLCLNFTGSAGQSFAAFATQGLTLKVVGNTNDYLGKGLCGAKVIIQAPPTASFIPHENIITGNVTLYGATSGSLFINGRAGERFAVRNSGATAVVEGIGDHGCEYMTGGLVLILGPVGRNFAAGMSGGVACVYDPKQQLQARCAATELNFNVPDQSMAQQIRSLLRDHVKHTGSPLAKELLSNWSIVRQQFVQVVPEEYRQALLKIAAEKQFREVV